MPSEDITFCGYDCPNTKCERNRKNIKMHWIDHSFAYFEDCVYRKNDNVRIRDIEDENIDGWGIDEVEDTEIEQGDVNIHDFNDGIVDPSYINDYIDCSDLGIFPWGNS